jgi:predicted 3-demethylubiquinone-9 3-methyltransferase (glyoxalase superfamily)
MTVEFEIAGQQFTVLNGGPHFKVGPSISFFAQVDSTTEADLLFAALEEHGSVMMPIGTYPWSQRYGWVQDRFGVSWQVMAREPGQSGAMIVPCLMFAGAVHGKAEEAMHAYARIFPGGRVDRVARYSAEEGPEGSIKHGRCVLSGQDLIVMDSHIDHGLPFNEGVSLQVMCRSQEEIDQFWEALSEGGEKGPCGWLKDRFGVSWQVVPNTIAEWMTSDNAAARDRAFEAMLKMKKPDMAALQAAFSHAG